MTMAQRLNLSSWNLLYSVCNKFRWDYELNALILSSCNENPESGQRVKITKEAYLVLSSSGQRG